MSQKDPLEKERATHSNILAQKIPKTEQSGGLQSMGVAKESDTTQRLNNKFLHDADASFIGTAFEN